MSIEESTGCMFTRRGQWLFQRVVAGVGWGVGILLVMISAFWEVLPIRMLGIVILFAVGTYTGILAINRRDDIVTAAFEMGRATQRDSDVTSLR